MIHEGEVRIFLTRKLSCDFFNSLNVINNKFAGESCSSRAEDEEGAVMVEECCRKLGTPPPPACRDSVLCFLADPVPTVAKS